MSTSASVLLGWHSGWPQTPLRVIPATASTPAQFVVGPRNSARWGDYFNAALRLSRTVPLRYGELSLWLDGTNITNRANGCCIDLNSSGPQGAVLLSADKSWGPRAVNIGFTWRVREPQ